VSPGLKAEAAVVRQPALARLWTAAGTPAGAAVLVGGLMVAAFVARILLAMRIQAPWEMPDEILYAETSRNFLSTGHYVFRDHPEALRTIYPALISPAWLAGSVHTAYTLVKVINVTLMTLGAIPLFLWARRLVSPLWAVFAVALYLAMPGIIYSGEILTENAFLPAAMLALFAMALALERPTVLRQLAALGAIALATAARLQGVVFLPVLFTAIALVLFLDAVAAAPGERRRTVVSKIRRFWPSLAAVAIAFSVYGAYELVRGNGLSRGLGTYEQISSAHYAVRPAVRWIAYHFSELAFSVCLIPMSALIVLFGLACRRATAPKESERAFLAVTTAAVVWVVVQVGLFASHFSVRIEERYMFNLGPALYLALVIWLARGLPRPPGLTAAAALVPVSLLLVLPYGALLTQALFNDTYGLIPVWRLTQRLGSLEETTLVLAACALMLGLLFAAVPRRAALVLVPVTVMAFLVFSTNSVLGTVRFLSVATRHAGGLQGDPSWVDHAIGKDKRVEVLYTTDFADPHVAWQAEFWNRSVRRVFGVTSQDPSIPDVSTSVDGRGRIVPVLPATSADRRPRYVLAAKGVAVEGTPLASGGQLVLWHVRPPLRLTQVTSGITPDGWTGSSAAYTVYNAPHGTTRADVILGLPLTGIPPAHVQATVGPLRIPDGVPTQTRVWATRKTVVGPNRRRVLTLPVRRGPFQIILAVSPTFSPSQFGSPDTRTLGVQARLVFR
jgi:hypothetical protein